MIALLAVSRFARRLGRLRRRLGEALEQRVADRASDEEIAVARVGALHQVPRRGRCAGLPQQGFDEGLGLVVALVELQIDLVEPHLVRRLPSLRQPLAALVRGQMQPDLEQQHAVVYEHLLQAARVLQALRRLLGVALAGESVSQQAQAIAAGIDPDLALCRQDPPVAPEARISVLVVPAPAEEMRLQVARVHPVVQEVQHLAHGFAIVPGEHDHHGQVAPANLEFGVQQIDAQRRQGLLVLLLGDLGPHLGDFEHGRTSIHLGRCPNRELPWEPQSDSTKGAPVTQEDNKGVPTSERWGHQRNKGF